MAAECFIYIHALLSRVLVDIKTSSMAGIGFILNLGILWFLIVLFTGSTDSDSSLRDTWIVISGVMLVGLVGRLLFGGVIAMPLQIVALYFLVDWACGMERKTTLRICAWYLGASIITGAAIWYLTRAR